MKALSDLITNREEELGISRSHSLFPKPTNENWEKCCDAVDEIAFGKRIKWKAHFRQLVAIPGSSPKVWKGHNKEGKQLRQTQINIPEFKEYTVQLVFNEIEDDNNFQITKAYYVAFNNQINLAYMVHVPIDYLEEYN